MISIAVPEQEPCLDPRELPIQQQTPLLMEGQTPSVLSNQQPNCSGGNDDYLTIFRELIADELQDSSGAGEIAQPHRAEGLDSTTVMSEDLLGTTIGWETPGQDISSETQFDSMFQPICPSLAQRKMGFSYGDDQDLPFENLTQVEDGHKSHGSQDIEMEEDGNTDNAGHEDIGMHTCSDRRPDEHSECDAGHHRPTTRLLGDQKAYMLQHPSGCPGVEMGSQSHVRDLASIRYEPPRSGLAPSRKGKTSQTRALKVRHLATGLY